MGRANTQNLDIGSNLKQKRSLAEFNTHENNTYTYGTDNTEHVEVIESNSQQLQTKRKRLRKYVDDVKDEPRDAELTGKGQTEACT